MGFLTSLRFVWNDTIEIFYESGGVPFMKKHVMGTRHYWAARHRFILPLIQLVIPSTASLPAGQAGDLNLYS